MRILLTSDSESGDERVRSALSSLGHSVEDPTTAGAGALLAERQLDVDAVVAVLWSARAPQRRRDALFVEIGIAMGRSIPVILVTRPGIAAVTSLAGLPRIVAADSADGLLNVQLELFLESVNRNRDLPKARRPTGGLPHASLAQTEGLDFEQTVNALLKSSAVEFQKSAGAEDALADFTLYFSGDDADLGVVLVEAKLWNRTPLASALRQASARLSEQVLRSGAGLGLLVCNTRPARFPPAPLVAVMSVDELRSRLSERSLPEVLRRARNDSIHGR